MDVGNDEYIIELFWKNSSYVNGLSVCILVALYVRMSVVGANKVEGTMSWCVGTNEILASKHDICLSQTRALWDRHFDSSHAIFSSFITAKGV